MTERPSAAARYLKYGSLGDLRDTAPKPGSNRIDPGASRLSIRPYGALGKYRFGNFATTVYSGSTTFATVLSATCPSKAYASSFPNP